MTKKFLLTMGGSEYGWSRHNEEGTFRDYDAEADRLMESAERFDLERIKLDNDFIFNWKYYDLYKKTLTKTGFGFAFKAIGFWETLVHKADYGDLILFVDSNHIIAQNPSHYYQIIQDVSVFAQDHIWTIYPNRMWTHRDTFVRMDCDAERYWNATQMHCAITGIKKDEKGMEFARDYLRACLDWRITFGEGIYPDFPEFKQNRHNQSVFSILVEKYKIPYLHRSQNPAFEMIIPELNMIEPAVRVNNDFRKEQDKKELM